MSLLDVLAPLPQFRSRRKAQDFIDELSGRGWLLSLSRMPRDTEWLPSAPIPPAQDKAESRDDQVALAEPPLESVTNACQPGTADMESRHE